MATDTDVSIVYPNLEKFGEGNGSRAVFPLTYQDRDDITVAQVNGVFVENWQGTTRMANSPRTLLCKNSQQFVSSPKWSPYYTRGDMALMPAVVGPDGFLGHTHGVTLGSLTGGPGNDIGGVYETDFDQYSAPNTYICSIWLRADVPVVARLAMGNQGTSPSEGGLLVNVTTSWKRFVLNRQFLNGATITRGLTIGFSKFDNPGVALTTKLYLDFCQTELNTSSTPATVANPSYYVPNLTNATLTLSADYVLQGKNVVFNPDRVPVSGDTLLWSGVAYFDSPPSELEIVAPTDLMAGISWRYDQAERFLALLRAKQEWYHLNNDRFWDNWFAQVFELDTANTFGIGVWAFILNVPLEALGLRDKFRYWAFGPLRENYTDSTAAVPNPSSGNFPPVNQNSAIVTPREKIWALQLRYYTLTGACSVAYINRMLRDVFGDVGVAFIVDNEDMTAEYRFQFSISAYFANAMLQYGLIPKPAGVRINVTHL